MTALLDSKPNSHVQRQPPTARRPQMLCVDDDPDFHATIEVRMRKYDVDIEHAYFGTEGIVKATRTLPDVVVMDQAMPRGNGEYFLETIKRNPKTSGIPVIVLTGMRNPTLKQHLLQAGAEAFLQKPVLFDELVHHLGRIIDLRERKNNRG